MSVDDLATYVLLANILPLGAFIGLYGSRSAWRSTAAGRTLMYMLGIVAGIIVLIIAARVFGQFPGRTWIALVFYALLFAAFSGMTRTLLRAQRSDVDPVVRIGRPLGPIERTDP